MFYSTRRILQYFKNNFWVYLLLIIFICIGLGIFLATLNTISSAEEAVVQAKERMQGKMIKVDYAQSLAADVKYQQISEVMAVSYQQYLQLQKDFGNALKIGFAPYYNNILEDIDNNVYGRYTLVFCNNEQFEMLFNTTIEKNAIYAGAEIYTVISNCMKNNIYVPDFSKINEQANLMPLFIIQNGELKLTDGENIQLKTLPQSDKKSLLITSESYFSKQFEIPLSQTIFVCIDYYEKFEQQNFALREKFIKLYSDNNEISDDIDDAAVVTIPSKIECILNLKFISNNFDEKSLPNFLAALNNNIYGYTFFTGTEEGNTQINLEAVKETVFTYQIIGCSILVVVAFSTLGVVIMFLNKRKKALMICEAYGAKNSTLFFEIFIELFSVNFIGSMLSIAASNIFVKIIFENIFKNIQMNFGLSIMVSILFAAIASIVPAIYLLVSICKLNPAQALKAI